MHTTIRTITAAALAGALSLTGLTPAHADTATTAVAAHDDEIILTTLTTLEAGDDEGVEYGAGLPDTDGDGIPDIWEEHGVILTDGTEIPLPDMGADPNRPDIFLQLNWMETEYEARKCFEADNAATAACATANTKSYRPEAAMLQDLVDLFDDHGINLHIDAGATFTNIPGYAETHGGQTEAYTQYAFGGNSPASVLLSNQDRLLGERANIFRLGVIGDQMNPGNRSTGTAIVGGNSFYVANIMNNQAQLRNTILHEFGHTLGLGHYGTKTATADIKNNERMQADYLSVMNYNHQFTHFNYSETPYTYTGVYGTRVVPADWDNLQLANDWIGFEAAAIGATADKNAVAEAEAARADIQAAEKTNRTAVITASAPETVTAGATAEITVEVTNPGIDLATYTIDADYPGATHRETITIEGVTTGRNTATITIPVPASATTPVMPVAITAATAGAIVAETNLTITVDGATAAPAATTAPVALQGETAQQLRQVVTTAKAEIAKADTAKADTAKADTTVEAAKAPAHQTAPAGKDLNIAAIIGPIVAILALLGIGAGAAFAL